MVFMVILFLADFVDYFVILILPLGQDTILIFKIDADLGKSIAGTKDLSEQDEETLKKAIEEFNQGFAKD